MGSDPKTGRKLKSPRADKKEDEEPARPLVCSMGHRANKKEYAEPGGPLVYRCSSRTPSPSGLPCASRSSRRRHGRWQQAAADRLPKATTPQHQWLARRVERKQDNMQQRKQRNWLSRATRLLELMDIQRLSAAQQTERITLLRRLGFPSASSPAVSADDLQRQILERQQQLQGQESEEELLTTWRRLRGDVSVGEAWHHPGCFDVLQGTGKGMDGVAHPPWRRQRRRDDGEGAAVEQRTEEQARLGLQVATKGKGAAPKGKGQKAAKNADTEGSAGLAVRPDASGKGEKAGGKGKGNGSRHAIVPPPTARAHRWQRDGWQEVKWKLRPGDLNFNKVITTIEALEVELDKGEPVLVYTDDPQCLEDFGDLMRGGCHPSSLLVFDGQACTPLDALQRDFPVDHKSLPGILRGGLKLRRCWVVAWTKGKPVVGDLPLDLEVDFIAAKAPKKSNVYEDSVVVRAVCAQRFSDTDRWKKIVHKPGAAIRDWMARAGVPPADLLDCWGWEKTGDDSQSPQPGGIVKGLLRLSPTAARSLLAAGGRLLGGTAFFCQPLRWSDLTLNQPALLWEQQLPDELHCLYLRRVVAGAGEMGLHYDGKRLAVRIDPKDSRNVARRGLWHLRQVPLGWHVLELEEVLKDVGFEQVEVQARYRERQSARWTFLALRTDRRDYVPIKLEDDEQKCDYCAQVFRAPTGDALAKRRYNHYANWHPDQMRRFGRCALKEVAMKILPKTSPADWRCPCCRMAVPKGELQKATKTSWERSRDAHRCFAHPAIDRAEYAKLCRKTGVRTTVNVMRQRARVLNQAQARRQVGGSASSAQGLSGFVCFTWPRLRRGKKNVKASLGLHNAWRCRSCPAVFAGPKEAKRHRCGQKARLKGNKGRLQQLRKLQRRAPKLDHGVEASLLDRTFAMALRMLSGGGAAKVNMLTDLLDDPEFPAGVLAVQELNLDVLSAASFVKVFKGALDAVEKLRSSGALWVLLGDYNLEPAEEPMATQLANGFAMSWDGGFETAEPLPARWVFSDHAQVAYDVDLEDPAGYCGPSFVELRSDKVSDEAWARRWDDVAFQRALEAKDVDGAWTLLSDTAEDLLRDPSSAMRCRRSSLWRPRARAHPRSKAGRTKEPLVLVALRRLARRLRQLAREPGNSRLRDKAARQLSGLETSCEWLSEVPFFGMELWADFVEEHIHKMETEQKAASLRSWRSRLEQSEGKAVAWIRRRELLKVELAWPVMPATEVHRCKAIHPTRVLQAAEDDWMKLWGRAGTTGLVPPLLRDLPSLAEFEWRPVFTADALLRAAKDMAKKAMASLWTCVVASGTTPTLWRLVVQQLHDWVDTWASHRVLGGVHGRGVRDCYLRVLDSLDSDQLYVQEDLTKFFDGIRHEDLQSSLAKLGAPRALCSLVRSFYVEQERVFTHQGRCGSKWHRVLCGVPQGCPLSPMLAGVVMALWAHVVEGPSGGSVQACSFVDDRLFWASEVSSLEAAKWRSSRFDAAYGFRCDVSKSKFVHRSAAPEVRALAASMGYEEDFNLLKARRRLRLIAVAAYGLAFKRRLVGMLVIPMLTWAGGFASISNDTLEALVMDFRWLLHKDMAADTPPVLCYEIADWEAHPGFARDLSALRCAIRLHSKVPVWIEDASLRLAGRRWPSLLPLTVSTLEQLGWGCDDRGSFVCRRDSFGQVRSFEVGVGSVAVLVEWLRDVYRRRGLEQCRRVTRSPVGLEDFFVYAGEALCSGDWLLGLAQAEALCTVDSEERLLAHEVPEIPLAPVALDYDDIVDCLAEALDQRLGNGAPVYVATDGSLVDMVAAWGVALDGEASYALNLSGEDQSAYRAEVEGLLVVARALNRCRCHGRVHILADCQSALTTVAGGGSNLLLSRRACAAFDALQGKIEVCKWWVPSHGKPADSKWRCPPCGEMVSRALNAHADRAARRCAGRVSAGSDRQRCARAREAAFDWEKQAHQAFRLVAQRAGKGKGKGTVGVAHPPWRRRGADPEPHDGAGHEAETSFGDKWRRQRRRDDGEGAAGVEQRA
ncbi:unnamed protein product, partial [Symbiodinium sp. KB8]